MRFSQPPHILADDPASADLIVAPIWMVGYGPCFEALRRSELYRKYQHKLVVYSPDDHQFPALPGLYPAAPRQWIRRGWALPAHYISAHIHQFLFSREEGRGKDLLFSFVGSSRTHPVRERILHWKHPGGVVIDASSKHEKQHWWEKDNKEQLIASYREVTRRSKFVVCPRGASPSSIRLFEAMEARSVPIIVADAVALPVGPKWDTFSVRVREKDIDRVPGLIERMQDRAPGMGLAARAAWEAYFSPGATVRSVVEWAGMLQRHPRERPILLKAQEYTTPSLLRARVRYAIGQN